MKLSPLISIAAACLAAGFSLSAQADDQPATAAPAPEAPSTGIDLGNDIKLSGHVESGVSLNPDSPANNLNFGQLFTDQANSLRMNQAMLTVERDLDPKVSDFQWGFKLQGMYGTDSRITHFFDEFDRGTKSPYQYDLVEANLQAHVPTFGGGTDMKIGQYSTPLGVEVIDATGNTFYSHSYIFNFSLPMKHTGLLTTTHVNDTLDIWAGIDTGVNDSLGNGENNGSFLHVLGGFGLNNLMDGNLTILALAHIGSEDPYSHVPGVTFPDPNGAVRQIYDLTATYKISDALTSTTEFNADHDDYAHASAEGVATYLTYTLSDAWSVSGRAETYRDDQGFFVAAFPNSLDYVNAERGYANSAYGTGKHTYGALTLGTSYKPTLPVNLTIRPEIRYDSAWGGPNDAFDVNSKGVATKNDQLTLAVDAIIAF